MVGSSGDSLRGKGDGGGGGGGGESVDCPTPPLFVDGGIDPLDFPLPPWSLRSSTLSRTSSPSPPPSPDSLASGSTITRHREIRSQVSLDALASQPISITPTSSRIASPGPSGQLNAGRWQTDPSVLSSQRIESQSTPSSVQDGVRVVHMDAGLRSAPGVIGLGEGWAGGPQGEERRGWYRKRRDRESGPDPLTLWPITEGVEPVSPVKAMWNRSKLRLFGASTTTLNDPDLRKKGFFSRSRVDLGEASSTASPPPLSNRFTRSQTDLNIPPPTRESLTSPSLPSIVPANNSRGRAKSSNDRVPVPDLQLVSSHASSSRDKGERASSTSHTAPTSWRRQAILFARSRSSKTTQVSNTNEPGASSSSTLIDSLDTDHFVPSPSSSPSSSVKLKRTNTFGGSSGTDNDAQVPNKVVGMDTLSDRTEAASGQGRSNTPSTISVRKQSILLRLKMAFSTNPPSRPLSPLHSSTPPLSKRLFSRQTPPATTSLPLSSPLSSPSTAPSVVLGDIVPGDKSLPFVESAGSESAGRVHVSPGHVVDNNQQTGKRRRASWEAWNQRLARLDEDDEEESNGTCRGFVDRVLPIRTSSLHSLHSLNSINSANSMSLHHQQRPNMAGSMSMPILQSAPPIPGEGTNGMNRHAGQQSFLSAYNLGPALGIERPSRRLSYGHGHLGRPWALAPALPPLHEWQSHSRSESEPIEDNFRSYSGMNHRRNQSVPSLDTPKPEESISSSDQSTLNNPVTPVQPQNYFQSHHTRPPLTPSSSDMTFGTYRSYRSALEGFGDTDSIHSIAEESSEFSYVFRGFLKGGRN